MRRVLGVGPGLPLGISGSFRSQCYTMWPPYYAARFAGKRALWTVVLKHGHLLGTSQKPVGTRLRAFFDNTSGRGQNGSLRKHATVRTCLPEFCTFHWLTPVSLKRHLVDLCVCVSRRTEWPCHLTGSVGTSLWKRETCQGSKPFALAVLDTWSATWTCPSRALPQCPQNISSGS